jgi:type II secretory ATPase GspE/PulE/Tfp pilus assembly ATPase PilB-like protein
MIKKAAVENGMTVMHEDAITKVLLGITTLEEALDVTRIE